MLSLISLSKVFTFIKDLLLVKISLPVIVFVLLGGWLYYDKHSAIRQAVDNAVTKLVAGSELAAKDALIDLQKTQLEQLNRTVQRQEERLAAEKAANLALEAEKEQAEEANKSLMEKLDAIPRFDSPIIDKRFYDLLPKR